jgi:hypothetical protein
VGANLLGVGEQVLHPRRELLDRGRPGQREVAPSLLDLAKDLGLRHEPAFEPAAEPQQEGISRRPFEMLERTIARESASGRLEPLASKHHGDPALAGVDEERIRIRCRGCARREMCAPPLQDIESP